MSAFRLRVYVGGSSGSAAPGQLVSQGTAWQIGPDVVATAFHVVGKLERRRFYHEGLPEVQYRLVLSDDERGETETALQPLGCDYYADVALLRVSQPLPSPTLRLRATLDAAAGQAWSARGYPRFMHGRPFTLSGRVALPTMRMSAAAPLFAGEKTDAVYVPFASVTTSPAIAPAIASVSVESFVTAHVWFVAPDDDPYGPA